MMKYVVILGDGMSDYPVKELGDRTPLMAASKPNMDYIAGNALYYGLAGTTRQDLPAGSDVANLSVLGYDPLIYYTGRGPLEAGSMGIHLKKDDIAFRCNLITVMDGLIADYSAGHITSQEASELIKFIDAESGTDTMKFYPGISYRHLLVINGYTPDTICVPPHDVVGQPVEDHLPSGNGSELLTGLVKRSWELLKDHPVNKKRIAEGKRPANSIWPWGQGRTPSMPSFKEKYGVEGSVISAVDLIKGLGIFAGLEVIDVPGATGYLDTDYGAKAKYALRSLEKKDFVFVHVEAPDEAGHSGVLKDKVQAIEDLDKKLVGPLLDGLGRFEDFRLMILPDHPTPLSIKTHARDPVPFAIYQKSRKSPCGHTYDESSMKSGMMVEEGHKLMGLFIKDTL